LTDLRRDAMLRAVAWVAEFQPDTAWSWEVIGEGARVRKDRSRDAADSRDAFYIGRWESE
jgi:hypothetical protein